VSQDTYIKDFFFREPWHIRGNNLSLVWWFDVCKSKEEGGAVGVGVLRLVNLALLVKWRAISRLDTFWRNVLVAKYGSQFAQSSIGGCVGGNH
jgi:hypothetical protein